ncbi:hypothetical protein DB30_04206 [Enhygromyxa salina]|uniref:Uncharacterized protein n=1 Tax=Enhygromyxa salina TaxID=215803 RepID=A0A0C2A030_9BACT|nr:hypothetical protein DB30_04206 [Enhygromyxa salina]
MFALVIAWPVVARAAARVVAPLGWSESARAAPAAQRRAGEWKDALGLRLEQVLSERDGDLFAETVAVFERPEPVTEQVFSTDAAAIEALASVVAPIVGEQPPEAAQIREISNGERVVWARWSVNELVYECVLAPSGSTATIVIMAALPNDFGFQRERLDEIVASLEGVTAPMPRFSLVSWLVGAVLVWLAMALALHAVMLAFVDQDHDHKQAGTRASLVLLALVAVGTVAAYMTLGDREAAIIHSGGSLNGLTVWILLAGIIVAGGHFLITSRLDRGVVRSAPETGAFASGTYGTSDVLRSSITRTNMRMRTEDLAATSGSWVSGPAGVPADTQQPNDLEDSGVYGPP